MLVFFILNYIYLSRLTRIFKITRIKHTSGQLVNKTQIGEQKNVDFFV